MTRTVAEWVGPTPDTTPPPRVRARVFEREGGRCHRCSRKIGPADRWTLEHVVALVNGGANAERNLSVTCDWCLPQKNAEDVAEKSRVARKRKKHLGIDAKKTKRRLPFGKHDARKAKVGGGWEWRDE